MSVKPPNPLSYVGEVSIPFISKPFPPISAFNKFSVPTVWVDTSAMEAWILVSLNLGTADWIKIGTIGGQVESVNVDAATPPGTDPVLPNGSYEITITGGQIAAASTANVIQTNSLAANTITVQIQRASTAASANSDVNGVCHFNSGHFSIDTDGFVNLLGGSQAIDSFTPDTGTSPVVPDINGVVALRGQTPASVSGIRVTGGTNTVDFALFSPFEGDFAFTQSSAASATPRRLIVSNSDTTDASSNSSLTLAVGGTSSGDPYVQWAVATSHVYAMGIDVNDSENFKLNYFAGAGVTPSTGTNLLEVTTTGAVTFNSAYTFPIADGTANQVLQTNGAGALSFSSANFLSISAQVFTTPGAFTYTPNSGVQFVEVELVGGGGGSGGADVTGAATTSNSAGAGGGGYAKFILTAAEIGASLSGVVGAGGTAGTAGASSGGTGSATTLATTSPWTVNGGAGTTGSAAALNTARDGGLGGTIVSGTGTQIVVVDGGQGGGSVCASSNSVSIAGYGGSSRLGSGGTQEVSNNGSSAAPPGQLYGGGAGGALNGNSQAAIAGAAGGDGIAIFKEYI